MANNSGTLSYVFQYKDYLGNVRLSYAKNPSSGLIDIIEENNYYPFGLEHQGYNNVPKFTYGNTIAEQYKYNGKELQDESIGGFQLNLYDYGARNYDPALGRWMNIDPLAEKSRRFNPYTYALNNPIYFIDPDGMKAARAKEWVKDGGNIESTDPPVGFDAKKGQIHKDKGGSWVYDDETTTWYGMFGAKNIGNTIELDEVVIGESKDTNVSSGEYGPYMGPDAMSASYSASVNGLFFSANISVGLALTGDDAAAVISGGINWGPQSDLSLPGIKGGWSIAAHNNEGNSSDVLGGLGGSSVGYFGGLGIGGGISQSALKNGELDPNGVSAISLNLGPTFGFGKTKSTGYSFKASEGVKAIKSLF